MRYAINNKVTFDVIRNNKEETLNGVVADYEQSKIGTLYVVKTPYGNIDKLTESEVN